MQLNRIAPPHQSLHPWAGPPSRSRGPRVRSSNEKPKVPLSPPRWLWDGDSFAGLLPSLSFLLPSFLLLLPEAAWGFRVLTR